MYRYCALIFLVIGIFVSGSLSPSSVEAGDDEVVARVLDTRIERDQLYLSKSYLQSKYGDSTFQATRRMFNRSLPAWHLQNIALQIFRDHWADSNNVTTTDSEVFTLVEHRLNQLKSKTGKEPSRPTIMGGFSLKMNLIKQALEDERSADWMYKQRVPGGIKEPDWMSSYHWILSIYQFEWISQLVIYKDMDYLEEIQKGSHQGKFELLRKGIRTWKFNRFLFQKYGGPVKYGVTFSPRPVYAWAQYFKEQKHQGQFEILEDNLERYFWRRLESATRSQGGTGSSKDGSLAVRWFDRRPWLPSKEISRNELISKYPESQFVIGKKIYLAENAHFQIVVKFPRHPAYKQFKTKLNETQPEFTHSIRSVLRRNFTKIKKGIYDEAEKMLLKKINNRIEQSHKFSDWLTITGVELQPVN